MPDRIRLLADRCLEYCGLFGWSLKSIYTIAPMLTIGLAASSFFAGLTPVAVFIAIRGLIDAQVNLIGNSNAGIVDLEALTPWLLLLFIAASIEAVVSLIQKLLRTLLLGRANIELSALVMAQAARQPVAFFELEGSQAVLEQLQGEVATRMVELINRIMIIFSNTLQILTLVAILVAIEPLILLIAAPLFLPHLLFQIRLSHHDFSQHQQRTKRRRRVRYYVGLLTTSTSAAELRLLGLADHFVNRFRAIMERFRQQDEAHQWHGFFGSLLFALLTLVGFFVVFSLVVNDALSGAVTIGDVTIFAAAVVRLRKSLEDLTYAISAALEQTRHVKTLRDFLALSGEHHPKSIISLTEPFCPEIRCDQISFRYPGAKNLALVDLSLHIRAGERVAIVGENGSGKTTLVKLLAGFYPPDQGTITIGGVLLDTRSIAVLRRKIAFVFQHFGRYSATTADNIAYGDWLRLKEDRASVEKIGQTVGLSQLVKKMPDGYDTLLGRDFGDFEPSTGVWQRIAIARAFARDAAILILDEPTASVDARAEYELFCQLGELAAGKTTILISHRFSTVAMADRILVMEQGHIVEQGTHNDLLALDGRYAKLYQYHQKRVGEG